MSKLINFLQQILQLEGGKELTDAC